MIDITGLDYAVVFAFFKSQYHGQPSILEKMASSSPDSSDPFESLSRIKTELTKAAKALPLDLRDIAIDSELLKIVERSD